MSTLRRRCIAANCGIPWNLNQTGLIRIEVLARPTTWLGLQGTLWNGCVGLPSPNDTAALLARACCTEQSACRNQASVGTLVGNRHVGPVPSIARKPCGSALSSYHTSAHDRLSPKQTCSHCPKCTRQNRILVARVQLASPAPCSPLTTRPAAQLQGLQAGEKALELQPGGACAGRGGRRPHGRSGASAARWWCRVPRGSPGKPLLGCANTVLMSQPPQLAAQPPQLAAHQGGHPTYLQLGLQLELLALVAGVAPGAQRPVWG